MNSTQARELIASGQYGIISAERGSLTDAQNARRTDTLRRILENRGLPFLPTIGVWEGTSELSFLLPHISGTDIRNIAVMFDQEAWIHDGRMYYRDGVVLDFDTDATAFDVTDGNRTTIHTNDGTISFAVPIKVTA